MRTFIGILALISLISCSEEQYTVIRGVDVFDGVVVIKNVDFVFTSEEIKKISANKRKYRNATIINGQGQTIIPPLINAHVHIQGADNLKEALSEGIFAVLDMFSTDGRANYFRSYNDSLAYATFYSSNVGATAPGGHGTQFGVSIPTVNDMLSPKEFVAERVSQNADYLKITYEVSMSRLDTSQLSALTRAIHSYNKIAIAHISDLQGGMEVIAQGIDGLAHIWYRQASISTEKDLEIMQQKEVFVIPTLSVITKLIEHSKKIKLEENYLTKAALKEEIQKIHTAGIPILAGTDSPNFNMDYSTQYFQELQLLKECGLTEIEVLQAATTNIYKHFKLEEFGQLKKGSSSSFILIEGQPHERMEEIANDKRIWKFGVEVIL
ncbi:MAG: amidohydrolase family protein [Bacteroidota bacterium]